MRPVVGVKASTIAMRPVVGVKASTIAMRPVVGVKASTIAMRPVVGVKASTIAMHFCLCIDTLRERTNKYGKIKVKCSVVAIDTER